MLTNEEKYKNRGSEGTTTHTWSTSTAHISAAIGRSIVTFVYVMMMKQKQEIKQKTSADQSFESKEKKLTYNAFDILNISYFIF